jgi:hypothetical protein
MDFLTGLPPTGGDLGDLDILDSPGNCDSVLGTDGNSDNFDKSKYLYFNSNKFCFCSSDNAYLHKRMTFCKSVDKSLS